MELSGYSLNAGVSAIRSFLFLAAVSNLRFPPDCGALPEHDCLPQGQQFSRGQTVLPRTLDRSRHGKLHRERGQRQYCGAFRCGPTHVSGQAVRGNGGGSAAGQGEFRKQLKVKLLQLDSHLLIIFLFFF